MGVHMKRKFFIMIMLTATFLFCITGCGKSQHGDVKIFFAIPNKTDTFINSLTDAAKRAAQKEGVHLKIESADKSIENQVSQIKKAVSNHYDVIMCIPVDVSTAVELKAVAKNLPVVFLNICPTSKLLKSDKCMYVGSNEEVAGQYQAEYILNKFSKKSELNVFLLRGPNGHSAAIARTEALKNILADSGKKINFVFNDAANWDTLTAKHMFETFLKTNQPCDCVISNNDSMALGVIAACKENHIDLSSLPVLGVDATSDGCKAIIDKDMAFTVYQSASGQGKAAIQVAKALGSGKSASKIKYISNDGKYIWVPFERVDSSNVQKYMK
jgi:inositol transport system substrate-binding protein